MGEPPPPAPADTISKIVMQAPYAKCLQEALQDVVAESLVNEVEGEEAIEVRGSPGGDPIPFDQEMANHTLQAFGNAASKTNWTGEAPRKTAPRAVLRGRIAYYNRYNDRWRIVVEDAEIRPRVPLSRKRRKRDRTSLWEASTEQPHRLSGSLQILAYDDR